jgi:hypothetical protein
LISGPSTRGTGTEILYNQLLTIIEKLLSPGAHIAEEVKPAIVVENPQTKIVDTRVMYAILVSGLVIKSGEL